MLDAEQGAKVLGISTRYLRQLGRDGKIATVRIGGCVRFEIDDLREWAKANRQEAKPQPKRSDHLLKIVRLANELLQNEALRSPTAAMVESLRKDVERLRAEREADANVMADKDKRILDLKDEIAKLGAKLSSAEDDIANLHAQLQRQEDEHVRTVGKRKAQEVARDGSATPP